MLRLSRGIEKSMNLSIVIPQIFYDLIARVFPGFLFLMSLRLELLGTNVYANFGGRLDEAAGSVERFLSGVGTTVVCYILGWLLHGLTFEGAEVAARGHHSRESLYEHYQRIRLSDAEAG